MVVYEGRVWLLLRDGKLIDDIDTDMIFHNSHLAITEISQMGQFALGNLKGYEDFAKKAQKGDIAVAGENMGAGSSRQQAVDCFKALGCSCVAARSYGAIYKRNAINSGFPIITVKSLDLSAVKTGDRLRIDTDSREITKNGKSVGQIEPLSTVQKDILKAGNIFEYGKSR